MTMDELTKYIQKEIVSKEKSTFKDTELRAVHLIDEKSDLSIAVLSHTDFEDDYEHSQRAYHDISFYLIKKGKNGFENKRIAYHQQDYDDWQKYLSPQISTVYDREMDIVDIKLKTKSYTRSNSDSFMEDEINIYLKENVEYDKLIEKINAKEKRCLEELIESEEKKRKAEGMYKEAQNLTKKYKGKLITKFEEFDYFTFKRGFWELKNI